MAYRWNHDACQTIASTWHAASKAHFVTVVNRRVAIQNSSTSSTPARPQYHRLTRVDCSQRRHGAESYRDSLNFVTSRGADAAGALAAEYVARASRLASHQLITRSRPLPADLDYRLAYESPQNLALELSKSILYEDANSIDVKMLKSLNSHGESKHYSEDSLWNGKPQQYFESINHAESPVEEAAAAGVSDDSLAI